MSLINENKLFSNVLKNIGDKNRIIEELVENAQRADAKNIYFEANHTTGILTVSNDGNVLEDFSSLLKVADSDYSNELVEELVNPAGMGMYIMMSACQGGTTTFHSGNKQLTINTEELFNNEEYRKTILSKTEHINDFMDGMKVTLHLGDNLKAVYTRNKFYSHTYPISIYFDSSLVKRKVVEWLVEAEGTGTLSGLAIGIDLDTLRNYDEYSSNRGYVNWFGKKIYSPSLGIFSAIVHNSHLFKPQLPDRTKLTNTTEELKNIAIEIEAQLKDLIQKKLDNLDRNTSTYLTRLLKHLNLKYDTTNLAVWSNKTQLEGTKFYEYGLHSFFIEVNGELIDDKIDNLSYLYSEEDNRKPLVLKVGKQECPQWVKDNTYYGDQTLKVTQSKEAYNASSSSQRYSIVYCENITLNDDNIDFFVDDYSTIYTTTLCVYDLIDYINSNASCDGEDTTYADLDNDLTLIANKLTNEVDLSSIIPILQSFTNIDIHSFTYSKVNKEITVFDLNGNLDTIKVK